MINILPRILAIGLSPSSLTLFSPANTIADAPSFNVLAFAAVTVPEII